MNFLMILNDAPYGTERTYNGLRLAANRLRKRLGRQHRVALVEREPTFALAASFLWVMTGGGPPATRAGRGRRRGSAARPTLRRLRATGCRPASTTCPNPRTIRSMPRDCHGRTEA